MNPWICPKCGRVWGPGVTACNPCNRTHRRPHVQASLGIRTAEEIERAKREGKEMAKELGWT